VEYFNQILVVIVPFLISTVFGYIKRKQWLGEKASTALQAGVRSTWEEVVRDKKTTMKRDQGPDSKFSKEDRESFRTLAKDKANEIMLAHGTTLTSVIKTVAEQDLEIENILKSLK